MAWLQAVPKPPEGTQRANVTGQGAALSRIARMKRDGVTPVMPPNCAPHIISRFIEIGMTGSTGMGPVPLSWCEIGEWQRQVAVTLAPWEARLLRQLSVVFIGESHRAESENCAAPWYTPVTDQERAAEAALMKKLFW